MAARVGTTPYLVTVSVRLCGCRPPWRELSTRKHLADALRDAEGYWNVYLAFFGDQQVWLEWLVVDQRDGMIVWRNGRQLHKEDSSGKIAAA
jgi:hypothetical protein